MTVWCAGLDRTAFHPNLHTNRDNIIDEIINYEKKFGSTSKKNGEQLTKTSTTVSTPQKRDIGRSRRRWREMDHLKANQLHRAVPIAQNLQHSARQNYILFSWMFLKQYIYMNVKVVTNRQPEAVGSRFKLQASRDFV